MITVYCVSNLVNGKCYIGQTKSSITLRWTKHIKSVDGGSRLRFHNAIRKYGIGNFSSTALILCTTQEESDRWEKYFIFSFQSFNRDFGYNLTLGGHAGIPNEETRAKISAANLGRKHSLKSREKMSAGHLGSKASEETKKKMSESGKKRVRSSEEYKSRRGAKFSEEHRFRISSALTGKERSPEHSRNISLAKKGKSTKRKDNFTLSLFS